MHIPVLLQPFLAFYAPIHIRYFVDGTLGAGGHSASILYHHPEIEMLFGIDQDEEALNIASHALREYKDRVTLIHGNFRHLEDLIPVKYVDGIFFDLGVSSMQLDQPEKGFSIYRDGPLDMRMDTQSDLTAAKIVNNWSEKKLEEIFRIYGEEPRSRQAAKAIVDARKKKKIHTTRALSEVLSKTLTWGGRKGKKIHPHTLIFQALRICVNDELSGLQEALPQGIDLLSPGGLFGVIAFHSLEDRIVKETFRTFKKERTDIEILTKKPIVADAAEFRFNPRSRSAKLRFLQRAKDNA